MKQHQKAARTKRNARKLRKAVRSGNKRIADVFTTDRDKSLDTFREARCTVVIATASVDSLAAALGGEVVTPEVAGQIIKNLNTKYIGAK